MDPSNKAVITCAVTGVLTDPDRFPVPVTVNEMAQSALDAFNAGATVMHLHFRNQDPGMGRMPSWEPDVAEAVTDAVRAACPGVIINMSTGVVGLDQSAPIACLERTRPEVAACNAGTLNYLKARRDGGWAWPPLTFQNPVEKVQEMLDAMASTGTRPEFECFDVGIVRSVNLFVDTGMCANPHYNFVMGVASGMPADPELLPLLLNYRKPGASWEVTAIGRSEVWDLHQRAAELGGCLRTGLEDTFYLPNGDKARGNGELIDAMAACVRQAGRSVASPDEARSMLGLT
jgi:3-keto-5-aminohexanoate cleavage enzyme